MSYTAKVARMKKLIERIKAAGETERYRLMSDLHHELGARPWDWPPDIAAVEADLKRWSK